MQLATSLQTLNLPLPFSGNFTRRKSTSCPKRRVPRSVCARKRDSGDRDNGDDRVKGKLVDENMIVLRLRIQEMKKKEKEEAEEVQNYATKSNKWMEWEKEWCKNYEADVMEGVGLLQILLMNTRPGLVALLLFTLLASLAVTLCYLLHFVLG